MTNDERNNILKKFTKNNSTTHIKPIMQKETYDTNFYEDVGDPLKEFRKKYGGAFITKNDTDPFSKDPDTIQLNADKKMIDKHFNS